MLIVIPVSSYEFQKPLSVLGFIKSLRHFGFYPNHELLVVSRPSDKHFAENVFDLIKDLFPNRANLHLFKQGDGQSGWPQGPNCYWKYTIEYLKENNNKQPWFWMELDCIALKPKWADILEDSYNKCGKLCFGTVQDTTTLTADGYRITIAKHLQGTAVYPPRLDEICSIWQYVDKLSTAFDVVTQWEIMPHVADTKLIQQGFRTLNYKIYESPYMIKGQDNGDLNGAVTYEQPIHPKAVVHHGCKDSSLSTIVISPEYNYWLEEICNSKRKIPVFYHIPKNAGTYVSDWFLIAFRHYKRTYTDWGNVKSLDQVPVKCLQIIKNGLVLAKFLVGDINYFCDANLKCLNKHSVTEWDIDLKELTPELLENVFLFGVIIESRGFKLRDEVLNLLKDYTFYQFLLLRDVFSRTQSFYNYITTDHSKHEYTHDCIQSATLEDYILSDKLEDSWLIRNLVKIDDSIPLNEEHFNKAVDILNSFNINDIKCADKSIRDAFLQCYNLDTQHISIDLHNALTKNETTGKKIKFKDLSAQAQKAFNEQVYWDKELYAHFIS